ANHVGKSDDSTIVWEGEIMECIKSLVMYLGARDMAKRFDFVIARSEEEARNALRIRERKNSMKEIGEDEDFLEALKEVMNQGTDQETNHRLADESKGSTND